jgi:hypothetical protein
MAQLTSLPVIANSARSQTMIMLVDAVFSKHAANPAMATMDA